MSAFSCSFLFLTEGTLLSLSFQERFHCTPSWTGCLGAPCSPRLLPGWAGSLPDLVCVSLPAPCPDRLPLGSHQPGSRATTGRRAWKLSWWGDGPQKASQKWVVLTRDQGRWKAEAALDKANAVCVELKWDKIGKIKVKIRADGLKLSLGEEKVGCYWSGKDKKCHKRSKGSTVRLVAKKDFDLNLCALALTDTMLPCSELCLC